jgi:hypothetical protein
MNAIILRDSTRPARAIEALVAWHGFWPVARALLTQMLHRRARAVSGDEGLSDHMRRDIGLPPLGAPTVSSFGHLHKRV